MTCQAAAWCGQIALQCDAIAEGQASMAVFLLREIVEAAERPGAVELLPYQAGDLAHRLQQTPPIIAARFPSIPRTAIDQAIVCARLLVTGLATPGFLFAGYLPALVNPPAILAAEIEIVLRKQSIASLTERSARALAVALAAAETPNETTIFQ
ncbi:hypothetical protein J8I29_19300 [Labrys sp. LIt4]|uniref:hypothetical protein n=1 Tax=Labrys sp. LIt4 TaxID=2821355 RepID=UPI001ADF5869|nr:hypothetical protein [Labrys sp. LIt4]MBP0581484.1 hypothetical protein [Labrys sp. LIt4]